MSRRAKTWLYAGISFAIMIVLIFLMAWQQGIDPLHPRTRHIWALSLVAALYASIRGAMYLERHQHRKKLQEEYDPPQGRRSGDIKERMAARRRRVEAAREREDSDNS